MSKDVYREKPQHNIRLRLQTNADALEILVRAPYILDLGSANKDFQ